MSVPSCRGELPAPSPLRPERRRAAGVLAGASGRVLRSSASLPGGRRPWRAAVTATSSPLFTSVFSSLITRFIAFARGKPGDGGAGEDPPRQPPPRSAPLRSARGGGETRLSRDLPLAAWFPAGFRARRGVAGLRRRPVPAAAAAQGRGSGEPPVAGRRAVGRSRQPVLMGGLHRVAPAVSAPAQGKKPSRIDGFADKQRR